MTRGTLNWEPRPTDRNVSAVAVSPDHSHLAVASGTKVELWDAGSHRCVFTWYRHAEQVRAVAWSPDGSYVASAGLDCTVQVWSWRDRDPLFHADTGGPVFSLAWSPDGTQITTGGGGNTPWCVWTLGQAGGQALPLPAALPLRQDQLGTPAVSSVSWLGDHLLVSSLQGFGLLLEVPSGKTFYHYPQPPLPLIAITRAVLSPDGMRAALGYLDGMITVWDREEGDVVSFQAHEGLVTALAWLEDGWLIGSGGTDQAVRLWDSETGELVNEIKLEAQKVHRPNVWCLAERGEQLIVGSEDGVHLYNKGLD